MKKKQRKHTSARQPIRVVDDKSFLIIVAGGFLIVAFALFFFTDHPGKLFRVVRSESSIPVTKQIVVIRDYAFLPSTITVSKGDTVYWSNQDKVAHTIAGTEDSFSAGSIFEGGEGSYTFSEPGTYTYYSTKYPNVKGTVIVEE